MFKNFSSLDHRSIFLVYYYRPLFRKKKKKKKKKSISLDPLFSAWHWTYPSKTKQNKAKQKQNPLKDHFFTSLHTPVHLWILLSARGGTLGKCSYWEGLAYE